MTEVYRFLSPNEDNASAEPINLLEVSPDYASLVGNVMPFPVLVGD